MLVYTEKVFDYLYEYDPCLLVIFFAPVVIIFVPFDLLLYGIKYIITRRRTRKENKKMLEGKILGVTKMKLVILGQGYRMYIGVDALSEEKQYVTLDIDNRQMDFFAAKHDTLEDAISFLSECKEKYLKWLERDAIFDKTASLNGGDF